MNQQKRKTAEGILFTDMYQFTMAQLYYRMGLQEKLVQFDHYFRSYPDYGTHKAGYCIAAGLEWLIDWMQETHFEPEEIEYLRSQKTRTGSPMFADDFLDWLSKQGDFSALNLFAIPEGRVVHPNVPLTVVRGPLAMAQILETALLNQINFQTLIATKAARMREIGHGQLMMEFGLRRAQERGGNAGARAALIGGADYTSNVGVSALLGIQPKGTHAHSMVQLFIAMGQSELDAFRAYADVYPDDCLLLVDTIDTLESGVPNAIQVFQELRSKGHQPVGIRLDSGDLAYLSIQASRLLDEAGFPDVSITLSNNLDELIIWQIITQIQEEAPRYGVDADHLVKRLGYGIGTRLITSWGEPALGGVYKLVAVHHENSWQPAIKISESPEKTPNPGYKNVWRLYDQRGKATADLLSLQEEDPRKMERIVLRHASNQTKFRVMEKITISEIEPLLVQYLAEGQLVADLPDLETLRARRVADVARLDAGVRRLMYPHIYHVSLTQKLWDLKQQLITSALNVEDLLHIPIDPEKDLT
ncbi:MAG TPA: nicotinate phosphoribosyltransferase [Anaerolineales bacterium]|nr:nicotinate phosphoribosyltransferase [Anaerolineales bacterium]